MAMEQMILKSGNNYDGLDNWIKDNDCKKILLVCDESIAFQKEFVDYCTRKLNSSVNIIKFNKFQSNPLYENVQKGVQVFNEERCDSIVVFGGGSAIDVAKCIKAFANLDNDGEDGAWLRLSILQNDIPFLCVPTTAGTGSESTRYAVIYYNGHKQSITSENIIPQTVLLNPDTLLSLPTYQKKATMADALCHAIESFWSVNSTQESMEYSKKAIKLILDNMDGYLDNSLDGRTNMLFAANYAGKAINISQTTAGHAMCYKITSIFKCAHGHAALLCDRILFPWMINNIDKCKDPRGETYLRQVFNDLARTMGCENVFLASKKLNEIFDKLNLQIPYASKAQFEELKSNVNIDRLKNHPIILEEDTIDLLYHSILNEV